MSIENQNNSNVEVQAKRGRGRPKKFLDVPSYLVCSVTGVKVKTTIPQYRKQLEKSGLDSATFQSTYVSRAGRRVLNPKPAKAPKKGVDQLLVQPSGESVNV